MLRSMPCYGKVNLRCPGERNDFNQIPSGQCHAATWFTGAELNESFAYGERNSLMASRVRVAAAWHLSCLLRPHFARGPDFDNDDTPTLTLSAVTASSSDSLVGDVGAVQILCLRCRRWRRHSSDGSNESSPFKSIRELTRSCQQELTIAATAPLARSHHRRRRTMVLGPGSTNKDCHLTVMDHANSMTFPATGPSTPRALTNSYPCTGRLPGKYSSRSMPSPTARESRVALGSQVVQSATPIVQSKQSRACSLSESQRPYRGKKAPAGLGLVSARKSERTAASIQESKTGEISIGWFNRMATSVNTLQIEHHRGEETQTSLAPICFTEGPVTQSLILNGISGTTWAPGSASGRSVKPSDILLASACAVLAAAFTPLPLHFRDVCAKSHRMRFCATAAAPSWPHGPAPPAHARTGGETPRTTCNGASRIARHRAPASGGERQKWLCRGAGVPPARRHHHRHLQPAPAMEVASGTGRDSASLPFEQASTSTSQGLRDAANRASGPLADEAAIWKQDHQSGISTVHGQAKASKEDLSPQLKSQHDRGESHRSGLSVCTTSAQARDQAELQEASQRKAGGGYHRLSISVRETALSATHCAIRRAARGLVPVEVE
ncbi:hypothetical protein CERZMDRAFT_80814 [Cercospora zeae-maydis SCOH1-5]|uniref:Uncharacterized protein n=1 Tax=Cercospora zeae-maydis SCOH1-5 TaxID=717836 RepID=A0A6A6FTF7_9PEZI|nr:hypothetical protein CERZMDRAFT_80814 [Cercospora zeae-maydis SCOH1-5]